jgi:acetyl esterase/lipase
VGLLLLGPGTPREFDLRQAKERGLRVWTFVGDDDWMLDDVLESDRSLADAGVPLVEERVPGVGHVVPENLAEPWWRWGDSNPRARATVRDFSGRSQVV